MARPKKWRKVCCLPKQNRFGPMGNKTTDIVTMSIDEYETIRLIDAEAFTQEECARQMNIARTTVQGIYNAARGKLAEVLIHGKMLVIEGGDYKLCNGTEEYCSCGGCHKHRCRDMSDANSI
ncbi:DUF134 domain-containing protein [Pectinatus brassicae]|uniref:UPF0251 protein HNR32_001927 n=1 Tax=Pectinatus brassicae TaxID=862415 RepID=A0A840UV24_9FIRM|nr:DUF134 domain-containing protein [Pectinatus brassicae]MBB5336773.1 putative DNA-binding protein (UPF0251 family) [Pectinatus brassicae]